MKRAIDKATKVITFHSITAKPKVKEGNQSAKDKAFFEKNEYNKWVDDTYMLMGKAYMYQGEFFLAAETFKHILVTFPDDDIRYLAMTWLARAYIMIDETERLNGSLWYWPMKVLFLKNTWGHFIRPGHSYHIKN